MNNTDNNAACYTFEQLLQQYNIAIPQIQRDYTQGRSDERTTRIRKNFVLALHTAIQNKQNLTLDFVYGNIDKDGILTLLDGQQRLTTLFLLHWYIGKKVNSDIELLKKFSYEIRPSTRDFCAKLLAFNPFSNPEKNLSEDNSKISYEITNQNWFLSSWKKDPSIVSMLTMLDEIHEQLKKSAVTWEDLSKITFYFLPLEDMGLTDDLYIKMNSRGKPLTNFEHFKAELDKQLSKLDNEKELASRIRLKFDSSWTDLLWNYRNSGTNTENDNIIDDEFLRYIHFICDVISYQKGDTPHSKNEFDLLKNFFTCKEHFEILEKYFDCWCKDNLCKIKCITPDEFLSSFINHTKEYKQHTIITTISKNIFQECLAKYTTNGFNLKQFVFLYAVTYYLQSTDKIGYTDFIRRIRIINNLIQNSDHEIPQKRMKDILEHVEEILTTGEVEVKENTFNIYQLEEEKQKLALLKIHSEFSNALFALEDHELLYGQIGILFDFNDIENITDIDETATKFISLFQCDYDKIDCALMAVTGEKNIKLNQHKNNYSQRISIENWRSTQQFGAANQESWKELFHQHNIYDFYNNPHFTSKKDFDNTREILLRFFKDNNEINNTRLDTIQKSFIKICEDENLYPFEYYYLKYNVFRPAKNGMSGKCFKYDNYSHTILRYSDAHGDNYNPYLKEACHNLTDNNKNENLFNKCKYSKLGQRGLKFNTCYLEHFWINNNQLAVLSKKCHIDLSSVLEQDLFVIHDINSNKAIMPIIFNQNKAGIDTENRIEKLKKYIELILEYENEEEHQDASELKEYLERIIMNKNTLFIDKISQ